MYSIKTPPPPPIMMYVGLFHYLTGGSSSSTSEGMPRGGFATNFGSGVAGTGVKGVEGTIVGCIFKALVSRLAAAKDDLATPENEVSLFLCFLTQLYLELHLKLQYKPIYMYLKCTIFVMHANSWIFSMLIPSAKLFLSSATFEYNFFLITVIHFEYISCC